MGQDIADLKNGERKALLQILQALRSIRYGSVQIIVQDGKIVQIDKLEKIRLEKDEAFGFGAGV